MLDSSMRLLVLLNTSASGSPPVRRRKDQRWGKVNYNYNYVNSRRVVELKLRRVFELNTLAPEGIGTVSLF